MTSCTPGRCAPPPFMQTQFIKSSQLGIFFCGSGAAANDRPAAAERIAQHANKRKRCGAPTLKAEVAEKHCESSLSADKLL